MIRTTLISLFCISIILCIDSCKKTKKEEIKNRVGTVTSLFGPPLGNFLELQSKDGKFGLVQNDYLYQIGRPLSVFGDILIHWNKNKDLPQPLPGRLLININPTELKRSFRWENSPCKSDVLIQHGILPEDFDIASVTYYSQLQNQRIALRVSLKKSMNIEELRERFYKHVAKRPELKLDLITTPKSNHFLITLIKENFRQLWKNVCPPNYFYLKENSILQEEFKRVGVMSMRRVFRSTEMPDPDHPGYFNVEKFKDRLEEIKQKYPDRTARAFLLIEIPDNMEHWFVLRVDPNTNLVYSIDQLKELDGVNKISVDYPVLATTNDLEYSDQWGLKNTGSFQGEALVTPGFDVNVEPAWASGAATQSVVVAVLDAGFKEDLDELQNRLWTNPDPTEIPGDGIDNDCNGYIDDINGIRTYDYWAIDYGSGCLASPPGGPSEPLGTHGTSVAGIIAAEAENNIGIAGVVGTDPVELMNITVGWCSIEAEFGNGSAELAEGLMYAVEKGADVANMSVLSKGLPIMMQSMVQSALSIGMVLVASAGNDGERFTKAEGYSAFGVFPASMEGVISVGGVQRNGQWWSSSNYGPGLDLVAPASEVRTLSFDPTDLSQTVADVVTMAGTSASSAFVSGAAAVILGRYPLITAPYMRQWLRATAKDITDPRGLGENLIGDDEWTGAGMLDIGTATTVLSNPNDQPLDVDLLVERLTFGPPQHFSDYAPDAVGGSPDLGITVNAPTCDLSTTTQPISCAIGNWRLEFAVGDAPTSSAWMPINIPDPDLGTPQNEITINPLDVVRTGSSYYRHTRVAPGHNYLNTDNLLNNTLYTVRLVAENKAGREFIAYDWIIPMRAKLTNPGHNVTIHGGWGYPTIGGFVDIRPNANYILSLADDIGNTQWSSSAFYPDGKYDVLLAANPQSISYQSLADGWGESSSAWIRELIRDQSQYPGWVAEYPNPDPSTITEGWVDLTLQVQTEISSTENDVTRLYLDNSHFTPKANWPINYTGGSHAINFQDLGGSTGQRLFVSSTSKLACLDAAGVIHWNVDSRGSLAIGDVDNDGLAEFLTTTTENFFPGMGRPSDGAIPTGGLNVSVHLWSSSSCEDNGSEDGTLYSGNWPITYNFMPTDDDYWFKFTGSIGSMAIADITGDTDKEIIFYQRPNKYYSIPVNDITPGYLRVLDKDGNEIWNREFDAPKLPFKVQDINMDGKSEILLVKKGLILQGDNTYWPGWDVETSYTGAEFLTRGNGNINIIVYNSSVWESPNYSVSLITRNGAVVTNWPLDFSSSEPRDPIDMNAGPANLHVFIGQVVAGGAEEIVLCENQLTVYDRDAQQVGPVIDLMGKCEGGTLLDVDGDGELEFVVLVHRLQRNVPPNQRRGAFLEAYKLDGTRLADSDNSWPIVVLTGRGITYSYGGRWNLTVAIGDIDGDNTYEVVQQLANGNLEMLELN